MQPVSSDRSGAGTVGAQCPPSSARPSPSAALAGWSAGTTTWCRFLLALLASVLAGLFAPTPSEVQGWAPDY